MAHSWAVVLMGSKNQTALYPPLLGSLAMSYPPFHWPFQPAPEHSSFWSGLKAKTTSPSLPSAKSNIAKAASPCSGSNAGACQGSDQVLSGFRALNQMECRFSLKVLRTAIPEEGSMSTWSNFPRPSQAVA